MYQTRLHLNRSWPCWISGRVSRICLCVRLDPFLIFLYCRYVEKEHVMNMSGLCPRVPI